MNNSILEDDNLNALYEESQIDYLDSSIYFNQIAERMILSRYLLENQNNEGILNESFLYDAPKYKHVISENGKATLRHTSYGEMLCLNDTCPISQEPFTIGEKITLLPCNHGFLKGEVEKWLETQCAECPICRYKMESIEIENTNNSEILDSRTHLPLQLPVTFSTIPIRDSRSRFFSSLGTIENITHPFGRIQLFNTIPHSYITQHTTYDDDDIENDEE
jgi:hypothetical protein